MLLLLGLDEMKSFAKTLLERHGFVADHFQTGTVRRPSRRKGCDHGLALRSQRAPQLADVLRALGYVYQEVKCRAVVPDVEGVRRKYRIPEICYDPLNCFRALPEPLPGGVN